MATMQRTLLSTLLLASGFADAQAVPLRAYTACHFEDRLTLVEKSALPSGVQGRTVQTITGPRHVPVARGEKLLFGYPGSDPFARVTVERLPAASFTESKADLIAGFDKILASDDAVARNYALKPTLNGFEINGLDRKQLEGNVLGIYLLLDNATHTALSIDFLNTQSAQQNFDSLESYAKLRDQFLAAYTTCLHAPSAAPASAKPVAVKPLPVKPAIRGKAAPSKASAAKKAPAKASAHKSASKADTAKKKAAPVKKKKPAKAS